MEDIFYLFTKTEKGEVFKVLQLHRLAATLEIKTYIQELSKTIYVYANTSGDARDEDVCNMWKDSEDVAEYYLKWLLNDLGQGLLERKKLARQEWDNWFHREQDLFNPNTVSDSLKIASWMAYKKAKGVEDVWD